MGSNLYPDLARLLKDAGRHVVRQGKGSHEIWFSRDKQSNIHSSAQHPEATYGKWDFEGSWAEQGLLAENIRRIAPEKLA